MLNQIILVGRLTETPKLTITESGKKMINATIAVGRPYKNTEGEYETDFIPVHIYNEMAQNTSEYVQKGDLIGIKGRVETTDDKKLIIITEKVTFLSSHKTNDTQKIDNGGEI